MAHADATVSIFSLATGMTESCRRVSKNGLGGRERVVASCFFFVLYEFNVCVVSDWSRDEDLRWSVRRDLLKDLGWGSASE